MATDVSLFERLYLGLPFRYAKCIPGRELRRKEKRKGFLKRSKKNLLKFVLKDVPADDGRHAIMGIRGLNPMEHVPNDLARHLRACNLSRGRRIHDYISGSDFHESRFLAHRLVDMYARFGCIQEAESVFKTIRRPNVLSHNFLMAAYVGNGRADLCRRAFLSMGERDDVSWYLLVAAFARTGDVVGAEQAFNRMPLRGLCVWSLLIKAFAERCEVTQARLLLDQAPQRAVGDVFALVRQYAKSGQMDQARQLFDEIQWSEVQGWANDERARAEAFRLDEHHRVAFDRMPERDLTSWNTLLQAYAEQGRVDEARRVFERMPRANSKSWSTLIVGYGRAGYMLEARVLFDKSPRKHGRVWAALVSAYSLTGHLQQARAAFRRATEAGKSGNATLWLAMLDAYVTAGQLKNAQRLVDAMDTPPLAAAWNSMIRGSAAVSWRSLPLIQAAMLLEGSDPDQSTFALLMSASCCSCVETTRELIVAMSRDFGLRPLVGHYNCLLLAMARQGRLLEAEELVETMPFFPDYGSWLALLAGCKAKSNLELGIRAAGVVLEPDTEFWRDLLL